MSDKNSDRMNYPFTVLHWNYRGFTEFPLQQLRGEETDITDIYLKENLISRLPTDIGRLERLESLYLSGNDITELPCEIAKLQCLKCLDVSGNRLKRVPEVIGDVRGLKFLILDDNELTELPLRLNELRGLRYLSVCDNKLRWLPQKPVYNYHHCEFRFWRNTDLKTIPYSLWFHMLRDQQTRSLNIGCLSVPQFQHLLLHGRCRLKLQHNSRVWEVDVECPPHHTNIEERGPTTPPSLLELSMRKTYTIIKDIANKLSEECLSVYSERSYDEENNNDTKHCKEETIVDNNVDITYTSRELNCNVTHRKDRPKAKLKYYAPADVLDEYFDFVPAVLKVDLKTGPVSCCENVKCRKPMFDFVTYEFCLGKIVLIDNIEDVILSAAFCSQSCANVWKGGKTNTIIPWSLSPQYISF
ncbi:leucine-rich repeat-containing protein 40 [Plutella xylostella]|uniref:leucine-rich repeat-containing protein 40 n=1 Tax=Plutella xylostella TaxID=51655 RepID=UPI002033189C|nr:leucine-rich repeat-containing protein 40 [Plutella xylostella]